MSLALERRFTVGQHCAGYTHPALGTFWSATDQSRAGEKVMKRSIASWVTASGLILGLSACTNPYDPAQRAIGGGLLGAGTGAAIGAAAGGGHGAALGAAIGG